MHEFSDMVEKYLRQCGMSVTELARISGIERSFMQKIVSGTRMPSDIGAAKRIAASLMMSPSEAERLLECFEIARLGPDTYYSRREIRH